MIAIITTILYVLSVSDESINNGTLQKGTAISRIDNDEGFQIYKFCNYLTLSNNDDSDLNDGPGSIPFKEENMYLITGKFSTTQDNSINVTIITNVHLPLDKEDIPAMKPTVHLLGKSMEYAQLSEAGFTLQIQVKPYLSKEQFTPFLVNLTHPSNGRFKNALTKAKKNSTIHTTGSFFFAKDQLYCEILEFQFVSAKMDTDNTITVPWKTKSDSHMETSSSSKSAMERRIALVRQNLATQPPPSSKPSTLNPKNKRKTLTTKIADISKSLLSQNQEIEICDSDQEIIDGDEEINQDNGENDEDNEMATKNNEENVGNTEEDVTSTRVSSATRRSKKRKSNK
jgi:hypothetical protein